jgi:tRNA(Ile)-lysidine synthase
LAHQGIASERLVWSGEKPSSRLQEAARAARYRLLLEGCRRHGILHLLVAHHADDQAETIAMRAARGSGPDGLAGMAALVEHPEARLLRPLLGVPRVRLTATLGARGIRWIDDPSNRDLRFERARLRQGDAVLPQARADTAAGRAARERRLAGLAVGILEMEEIGEIAVDQAAFARLEREEAAGLLGRAVQALGRRDYPPRRDRLARAAERLLQGVNRGKSGKSQDFTLAECRLLLRQAPVTRRLRWIVRPENGRKNLRITGQPLIPPVFFACDALGAPHLDLKPQSMDRHREPVQP